VDRYSTYTKQQHSLNSLFSGQPGQAGAREVNNSGF